MGKVPIAIKGSGGGPYFGIEEIKVEQMTLSGNNLYCKFGESLFEGKPIPAFYSLMAVGIRPEGGILHFHCMIYPSSTTGGHAGASTIYTKVSDGVEEFGLNSAREVNSATVQNNWTEVTFKYIGPYVSVDFFAHGSYIECRRMKLASEL